MSAEATLLPEGFAALEPFAAEWAGETGAERSTLRGAHSLKELEAFYAAARDLIEPALDYLDAKPLATHDEKEKRLMRLMLTLAHVSLAVEVQRDDEARHSLLREPMRITRTPADVG